MERRYQFIILFLLLTVTFVSGQNITNEKTAAERFASTLAGLKKVMGNLVKAALPLILEQTSDEKFDISGPCRHALFRYLVGLKNMKPWAIHMVDSSGKFVDGFLLGTSSSFGNFEQCLAINAKEDKKAGSRAGMTLFRGQYCTILARPRMPEKPMYYSINHRLDAFKVFENNTELLGEVTAYMQIFYILPIRIGICVPSSCKREDIHKLADGIIGQLTEFDVTVPRCEVLEDIQMESYQLPVICTFAVLLLVLVCGTAVDVYHRTKEKRGEKIPLNTNLGVRVLKTFSVSTNFRKLMDVESGEDKLKVLHGIRFYTMTWIILGHTYFHLNFAMLRNLKVTLSLTTDIAFNIIANATLTVENFFFISGLLLAFVSCEMKKRIGATPKIWMFVIHRFWRFLPLQMAFVGFTLLLPWFGSGPLWGETIDPMIDACRKDWWANMIFINNFYRSGDKACVSHSWYLAADIQIYYLSLIVIYFLFRSPRIGLTINAIFIVISVATTGIYNYLKDLPPTMLFSRPDFEQRLTLMRQVYYTPYHHLSTVCIGVFVGHFLQSPCAKRKIHPALQLTAWLLTAVVLLSTLLGVHTFNVNAHTGALVSALYASLSRVAWTLGMAWITWACSTGHGGFLSKLLCWRVLVPLSRLTFSVYMIHPLVQHVFYLNLRVGIDARNHLGVFMWFAFTTVSYLLAFIICMCIESPFISLGGIIFEKHKERVHKQSLKEDLKDNNFGNQRKTQDTKENLNGHLTTSKISMPPTGIGNSFGTSNDGFICHL